MSNLSLILRILLVISGVSLLVMALVVMQTVGRRFEKLFGDRVALIDPQVSGFGKLIRTTMYASSIVFKHKRKNKEHIRMFGDYDFRKNATKSNIVISYIYIYTGIFYIIFSLIICTIKYLT